MAIVTTCPRCRLFTNIKDNDGKCKHCQYYIVAFLRGENEDVHVDLTKFKSNY